MLHHPFTDIMTTQDRLFPRDAFRSLLFTLQGYAFCGDGHQGKQFSIMGSDIVFTFTSDYSDSYFGFKITVAFIESGKTGCHCQKFSNWCVWGGGGLTAGAQ